MSIFDHVLDLSIIPLVVSSLIELVGKVRIMLIFLWKVDPGVVRVPGPEVAGQAAAH